MNEQDKKRQSSRDTCTHKNDTPTRSHEPEPDHDACPPQVPEYPFPHHRLDAYHVSLHFLKACHVLSQKIPRGHRNIADQINRASASTVLNLSEGANKYSQGDKRKSFRLAQGECGEAVAALEMLLALELVVPDEAQSVISLAGRVAAMLTGLIKKLA